MHGKQQALARAPVRQREEQAQPTGRVDQAEASSAAAGLADRRRGEPDTTVTSATSSCSPSSQVTATAPERRFHIRRERGGCGATGRADHPVLSWPGTA